jgi:hypothetical protein
MIPRATSAATIPARSPAPARPCWQPRWPLPVTAAEAGHQQQR